MVTQGMMRAAYVPNFPNWGTGANASDVLGGLKKVVNPYIN